MSDTGGPVAKRERKSEVGQRATAVTMCGSCDQMVGVMITLFNKGKEMHVPKTSRHNKPGGGRCPGSLLSVHPNTVMAAS